ncbi:DUF4219 domain-containing protein, partial [Tanacetum coccineum]
MDSDKYLEGQSMQRPPLFESDSFIYWKNRFETYVKSKDLDLWHVITNGDFQPIIQNPETKLDEVVPFEKQTDDLKRRLAKNNEAKMVIYNALPRKEYERIFMCNTAKEIWKTLLITHQGNSQVKDNKIDLLVQQYEQFVISEDESIDSAFARFNTIITSLKALDEGYSSKNYVRKFLRALHPKWRAKVTAIEESKNGGPVECKTKRIAIDGGLGLSDCARGEGYRGNGEVGMGRGELVVVLGRWFGTRNHGEGWFGFWRQGHGGGWFEVLGWYRGIQESKMTRLELFRLKSMWGNYNFDYACSLARGRSGGLVSMWDSNSFVKDDIWCDDAFIIVKGRWKNRIGDCYMVNIYGPHDHMAKNTLWNRIYDFMPSHSGKYILFGDMNEVREENERLGSIFSRVDADIFNHFISRIALIDLPMGGHAFTWMNKAGTKLSKLDRFLITEDILESLADICVTALDRSWSDHNPILLQCNKYDFGPIPFKLYHSWFLCDGFDEVVTNEFACLGQSGDGTKLSSHVKLKLLKAKIKEWYMHSKNNECAHKQDVVNV